MVTGLKILSSEAWTTVSVWLVTPLASTPPTAMLPAPFVYPPAVALDTLTVTVQLEAPTAAFTPVPPTVKTPAPATAVIVGAPPQLFTTPGTAAMTRPTGSVSVKVRLARAGEPTGLVMVKVSVEAWLTPTVVGANALVSDGSGCTVRPELVTPLLMPARPLMFAAVLLYGPPITLEVTFTLMTHEACALPSVAPVTVIVPLAATAVTTPVPDGHVVVTPGAAATTTFAGSVSVKLMPDWAGLPALLESVKVRVDVPPVSIAVGANALLSAPCSTVSVWL